MPLSRVSARFAKLLAAFREGRLRPLTARAERRGDGHSNPNTEAGSSPLVPGPKKPRVPGRFGWMIRITQGGAVFSSQLQFWLDDAEVQALIVAEPRRVRRLLGPICSALGVPLPEALRLPKRPRRKRLKPDAGSPGRVNPEAPAGSPNAASLDKRPTKAEIQSWQPGQRRPIVCRSGRHAEADPLLLIRPEPEPA